APAAPRDDELLARLRHVGEEIARELVEDLGPQRDADDLVLAAAAVAVAAHAVLAALGPDDLGVGHVLQRGEALVGDEDHVAALAAVAAGGPAERHELLASERDRAVAAVAG